MVLQWGSIGWEDGQFIEPEGIAVSDGYVYVVDSARNRVQKFDDDGEFITAWGGGGTGEGEFQNPHGIAVYDGYVYVADTDNNRIQKFDADDGEFITAWGSQGTGEGQFRDPEGVAVSGDGYIYVADTGNDRVQKFDADGEYVPMEGTGIGEGQLIDPEGVAVSSDGYIYVTEPENNQIKKYDAEGDYILKWGSEGSEEGQLKINVSTSSGTRSDCITVSNNGYVYVADIGNSRIQKFNSEGEFELAWGSAGVGDWQFNLPRGIAASSDGYIYVADTGNHRVQKFDNNGVFISKWGSYGEGDGQFGYPDSIAVSGDGYVYVADNGQQPYDTKRVQKFDADGRFIHSWDESSWGEYTPFTSTINNIAVSNDYMYFIIDDSGVYEFTYNWAVQLSGVEEITLPDSIEPKTSKTLYEYDDYGNVVVEYLYGDLDTNEDDATIHHVFYPNEELNILNKPAEERVYATITDPLPQYEILRPDAAGDETNIEFGFPGSGLNFFVNAVDVTPTYAGSWQDIDASSYIPAGSTGVILCLECELSTDVGIRKNGSTDDYYCLCGSGQGIIVGVDTDRIFQAKMESVDSGNNLYLIGYTYSNITLFDNCIDKSTDTTGNYVDVDVSGDGVPAGATGAIFFFHNTGFSDYDCALRKNGSSDDIYAEVEGSASGGILWGISGLDANRVCEQKIENTDVDLKLIGYTEAPVTFLDNAVDKSLTTTGSWVDIDLTADTAANADGAILSIKSDGGFNRYWGLQHKDSTDDYTWLIWTYALLWRNVGLDNGQICEGYISDTAVDFYLRGYTYPAAQHWENVDESNHDGDTSSVSGNETSYQRDLYNVDDHSAASGEINSVTAYAVCRADDTPTQDGLKIVIKSGEGAGAPDTISESSEITVTDSYDVYSNQWDTNPATGNAWTWDEIDNLQVGVAVRSSGDYYHTYCTQTYVEVEYSIVDEASLSRETHYYYDGNDLTTPPDEGNLTQLKQRVSEEEEDYITSSFTYDSYGNMLTSQDPEENVTTWTYETTHHTYPETVTSPVPDPELSESYTYDPGTLNLLSITDFNEQTTTYQYDTFKRLTKVIRPGDSEESPSIEYQYNNWSDLNQQHLKKLTKVAEGDYLWQSQYFDGLGRVLQVHARGEAGRTVISTTTAYNDIGLADKNYVSQDLDSSQVDGYMAPEASWRYTSYEYDGLGRVTTQTNADGTLVSHDYSIAWQELVTNELGFKKNYYFDAFKRLVKVEELDGSYEVYATTQYSYDILGNLIEVVDNDSNAITISYDWLSRKIEMTDPDMGTWYYGYDDNGNLTSQTDAKDQTIEFEYDELNRLLEKSYPLGSGMTNVTYIYDAYEAGVNYGKGQRTSMTDAIGTTSYKYDTWGRLIEEKRTIDSVDYTTQFTYDGANRVTSITYPTTGETAETVTQEYNGRGLPYSLSGSDVSDLVTSTLYNYLGQISEINLGNGLRTMYGYWDVGTMYDTSGGYYGRLWRVQTATPWHDSVVQDEKYTWDAGGNLTQREDVLAEETETFTYDFLDRLTYASGPYIESYAYDEIGNIISKNGISYSYGSQPHAVTAVGATSYSYDDNGNMTNRGNQTLDWDVENRLVSVDNSTFVYDGNGNRVKKTEGGETILYVNKYYEKNLTTGEETTYYFHGAKLVAKYNGTELSFIHQDNLTSTSVMTDSTGNELGTIKYFPFGSTRSGSVPTDIQFTGQRLDETGLYYYGARYYDAEIGRFISADTIVPNPANRQSYNRYSYCLNNPLKYTDPDGQDYIIVEGQWADENTRDWEGWLRDNLNISPDEQIIVLPDISFLFDIGPRLNQLKDILNSGEYTDIKIIGFSEGAAVVAALLYEMSIHTDNLDPMVAQEIKAAILLECPTAFDWAIGGFETAMLYGLPLNLYKAGYDEMALVDIWNTLSPLHISGELPGWGGVFSQPYSYYPWSSIFASLYYSTQNLGVAMYTAFQGISQAHSSVFGNPTVMAAIAATLSGQTVNWGTIVGLN